MDKSAASLLTEELLRNYLHLVANQSIGKTGNITFHRDGSTGKPIRCPLHGDSSNVENWEESPETHDSLLFYTIFTSITFLTGLLGNGLCLLVFGANAMSSASTNTWSYCLAALSLSDLLVLVFHVSVEWSQRGLLPLISKGGLVHIVDRPGVCQAYLMISYLLRMNSVWLIVLFTMERYIGVCRPLQRKILCTRRKIRRAVFFILGMATIVSCYKPILSEVDNGKCGSPQDQSIRAKLAFALDTCYALLITLIPFVVILTLNIIISRRLFLRRDDLKRSSGPDAIGLQFGVTMMAISTCFVILNFPYFVVWCLKSIDVHRFMSNQFPSHSGFPGVTSACVEQFDLTIALLVTRAVFHLNYCVNFFLYSLTGAFFRKEIVRLLHRVCCRHRQNNFELIAASERTIYRAGRSYSTNGFIANSLLPIPNDAGISRRVSNQF